LGNTLAYNANNAVLKNVSKRGDDQEPSKRANPVAPVQEIPHNYAEFLFVSRMGMKMNCIRDLL